MQHFYTKLLSQKQKLRKNRVESTNKPLRPELKPLKPLRPQAELGTKKNLVNEIICQKTRLAE